MQQTYIQMRISSTEALSKQLVAILSARNEKELIAAMGDNEDYWKSVFCTLEKLDFSHLYQYHSFSHTSNYSYVTLDIAIKHMANFANGSIAYGNPVKQERKFKQMLMALSFLDCDLYVTLLTKRFKWSLVEQLLKVNQNGDDC